MKNTYLILLSVLVTASIVLGEECKPGHNCKPPHCRCWNDHKTPGNLHLKDTPQMILLTFSYAMNNATISRYMPLFQGVKNPNGCPPTGTFFTQKLNTDGESVKWLYDNGHEIALTASDGEIPRSKKAWVHSLDESSSKLISAGIPLKKMTGVRSPQEFMGGNHQLQAMKQLNNLHYDASCVTHKYDGGRTLWPFTYDFVDGIPKCDIGFTPNTTFAGLWQFMMPDLSVGGHKCSVLSGCSPFINSSAMAFNLLQRAFIQHYNVDRTPLVLFVDAQWMTKPDQKQGLKQFLEVVDKYDNVWMVTMSQALEWIKDPKAMKKHTEFKPWACKTMTR